MEAKYIYKAEYQVKNGHNSEEWFTCQSDSFVDESGEYIHHFDNKEDAIKVAKEWKNDFGEKVRVVKYIERNKSWKEIKAGL